MKFKPYYLELDAAGREQLATRVGTSVPYLSQLAYGHRVPSRKLAQKIEAATGGRVRAWEMLFPQEADTELLPKPEFVCPEGAPCTEVCEICLRRLACPKCIARPGQPPAGEDPHQEQKAA